MHQREGEADQESSLGRLSLSTLQAKLLSISERNNRTFTLECFGCRRATVPPSPGSQIMMMMLHHMCRYIAAERPPSLCRSNLPWERQLGRLELGQNRNASGSNSIIYCSFRMWRANAQPSKSSMTNSGQVVGGEYSSVMERQVVMARLSSLAWE